MLSRALCFTRNRAFSVLKGNRDRFGGVNVYSYENTNSMDESFPETLQNSLEEWKQTGVRGAWFHVSGAQTSWISHLISAGFEFHHAKNDTAVLTRWLPEDESSGIPEYPHTYLGVGTITINAKNEILVIKEKVRFYNNWKFPGGYVDRGENILDAAVREVKEETGVQTEALGLVGFRHVLPQKDIPFPPFKCADIYAICALRPTGDETIVRQEREVSEAEWLPVDEFLEKGSSHNTHFLNAYLRAKEQNVIISPHDFSMKYGNADRHMLMYFNDILDSSSD